MSARTLPGLLDESASRFSGLPAVQWAVATGKGGFTYAELRERARRGAAVLRSFGVQHGDRVLLVMDGCPEWAASFFAILEAGFVAVPLPAETPPEMVAGIARHAGAKGCLSKAPIPGLDDVVALAPEGLFSAGREVLASSPVAEQDLALLAFTSGSTTSPRAVELTHASLVAELDALLRARHAQPDDALLSMLPPAHLFELVVGQLGPLCCGARVVYPGSLLPNRLVEALRENGITRALAVPSLVEALSAEVVEELSGGEPRPPGEIARSLSDLTDEERDRLVQAVRERIGPAFRMLGVGGAALDPVWADVLQPLGIRLEIGYGLTEAGPLVSLGVASECPPGSVGRPLPGVSIRVDEQGEILVRAPHLMRGYFRDPEGTAQVLRDGWLHTGDRGSLDAQGFLFISGRIKEAIVTAGGETLYPEEVEPYYEAPLFAELCVVPLRGPQGNDVPALVVVPAKPDVAQDEIERTVARLRAAAPARCRVAAVVRLGAPLPRTSLGKIRRRALAEALAAGKVK